MRRTGPTIRDVARCTQLSVTTISGILNHRPGYSAETCQRVWDAANELGYHPNTHAQAMRSGQSPESSRHHLLLHVYHTGRLEEYLDPGLHLQNTYSALFCQYLTDCALLRRYFVTHYWYCQQQGFRCTPLLDNIVDGVLLGTPHAEVVSILKGKLPLVLWGMNRTADTEGLPLVNVDIEGGLYIACKELVRRGYRTCALIGDVENVPGRGLQPSYEDTLSRVCRDCGLVIAPGCDIRLQVNYRTHEEVVRQAAVQLVQPIREGRIDVLLTSSISYAQSIYRELSSQGLNIPGDVGLLTIDHRGGIVKSPFSTVSYDWRKIMETGLDLLLQIIEQDQYSCGVYWVRPLIELGPTLLDRCPARS